MRVANPAIAKEKAMKRFALVALSFFVLTFAPSQMEAQTSPMFLTIGGDSLPSVTIARGVRSVWVRGTIASLPNLTWEEQVETYKKTKVQIIRRNNDRTEDLVAQTLDCDRQRGDRLALGCVSEEGEFFFGEVPGASEYIIRMFQPGGFAEFVQRPQYGELNVWIVPQLISVKGKVEVVRVNSRQVLVAFWLWNDTVDTVWDVNITPELVIPASIGSEFVVPCEGNGCSQQNVRIVGEAGYGWYGIWNLNQIEELNYIHAGASLNVRLRVDHARWRDLIYVEATAEFRNPRGLLAGSKALSENTKKKR